MLRSKVVLKKPRVIYKDLSKEECVGLAYDDENKVEIHPDQTDSELFKTVYHELAHITLPDLQEKHIVRLEKTVGQLLWLVILRLKRKWARQEKKFKKKKSK